MGLLLQRINIEPSGVRIGHLEIESLLGDLEQGAAPVEIVERYEIEPLDVVAALAYVGLGGPESLGPALVQTSPGRPALAAAASEPGLAALFADSPRKARLALAAGLLQILDFWDQSHSAAQAGDDLGESHFCSYWHAIAHRREPDMANALYWFRRVGGHVVLRELATASEPMRAAAGPTVVAPSLVVNTAIDPAAMIKLCQSADRSTVGLARKLQRLEMELLLDATVGAVIHPAISG